MKKLAFDGLLQLAVAEGATSPAPGGSLKPIVWSTATSKPMVWDGTAWTAVDTSGTGGGTSTPEVMVVQFNLAEAGNDVFVDDTTLNLSKVFLDGSLDPANVGVTGQRVFLSGSSDARHGVFVLGSVASMTAVPIVRDSMFPVGMAIGGMEFLALRGNRRQMNSYLHAAAADVNVAADTISVSSSFLFPKYPGGALGFPMKVGTWESATLPAPLADGKVYYLNAPGSFSRVGEEYRATVTFYDPVAASYVNFTSSGVDELGLCLTLIPQTEFGVVSSPSWGRFDAGAMIGSAASGLRATRGGNAASGAGANAVGGWIALGDDAMAGESAVNVGGDSASSGSVTVGVTSRAHEQAVAVGSEAVAASSAVAVGQASYADTSAVAGGLFAYAETGAIALGAESRATRGQISIGLNNYVIQQLSAFASGASVELLPPWSDDDVSKRWAPAAGEVALVSGKVYVWAATDPIEYAEFEVSGIFGDDGLGGLTGWAAACLKRCSSAYAGLTLSVSVNSPAGRISVSVGGGLVAADQNISARLVAERSIMGARAIPSVRNLAPDNAAIAVASEALGAGQFVQLWNNGGVLSARKADSSLNRAADGFVTQATLYSARVIVLLRGDNIQLSGLTVAGDYYLGNAGGVTSSVPVSGTFQRLGKALSANELMFQRETPIQL